MENLDYDRPQDRVLGEILRRQAERVPTRNFLVTETSRVSFAQAYELASRYAVGMRALGIGKGDRVCLYMGSGPDFVLLTLAANLIGAQWIPVNTDYRGDWLESTLADSQPALLITDSEHVGRLAALSSIHCGRLVVRGGFDEILADKQCSLEKLLAESVDGFEAAELDWGDVASVMWTSGTTGRSKGVMQSHNAWVRAGLSIVRRSGVGEGPHDVIYSCMPLYNSAAWVTGVYPALLAGVPCAMDPAFSATTFWDRTRFYGATHVFTLGAMHMFLWSMPQRPDDADNPVRVANMIPMPDDILEPFCRRFGIEAIHQGFGQSEVMLLLVRDHDRSIQWQANALGIPAGGIEVALFDDDGQPVATGEVGEFCVKATAPHVIFNGYFNDPEATRKAFRGEWFCTGDLGRSDEDGNFFFVDRKKDLIRYKGRSVSSVAIESVARRHPAVEAVAAYGLPSAELESEHEIGLAVVCKESEQLEPEQLARFINDNAPYFFVPRYIDVVDELPMTPTQKVRKVALRERGIGRDTWDARAVGFVVER